MSETRHGLIDFDFCLVFSEVLCVRETNGKGDEWKGGII